MFDLARHLPIIEAAAWVESATEARDATRSKNCFKGSAAQIGVSAFARRFLWLLLWRRGAGFGLRGLGNWLFCFFGGCGRARVRDWRLGGWIRNRKPVEGDTLRVE